MVGAYEEGETDGYFLLQDTSKASMEVKGGRRYRCSCKAHQAVASTPYGRPSVDNLKKIIRAPIEVDAVTGNE